MIATGALSWNIVLHPLHSGVHLIPSVSHHLLREADFSILYFAMVYAMSTKTFLENMIHCFIGHNHPMRGEICLISLCKKPNAWGIFTLLYVCVTILWLLATPADDRKNGNGFAESREKCPISHSILIDTATLTRRIRIK